MNLYEEFYSVVSAFEKTGMDYAIVGGLAVSFHTTPRFTKDIDLLFYSADIDHIRETLRNLGYTIEATPWTFKESDITLYRFSKFEGEEQMIVDIMQGNTPEHQNILKNALREKLLDITVPVASRKDLIAMKKIRNSAQDRADIEALEQ